MYKYMNVLLVDQDPAVILAAHLNKRGNKYEQDLLNLIRKISICHTSANRLPVPNIPELFQIPFEPELLVKNEMIVQTLRESCIGWTKTINDALNHLPKIEILKTVGPLEYPKVQIEFWRGRQNDLIKLIEDFTFPAFERSLAILDEANIIEVKELKIEMNETNSLLVEAKDHVKFLGTIEDSLEFIRTTNNFLELIGLLPGVAVSLRNIWLLSKFFATDKKIHGIILMISKLINQRIIETIKLSELVYPDNLKVTVELCVKILETWRKSFLKVRMDIEESRKEARWEFEINDLFCDTDHITIICKDILIVCQVLIELKNSFLPELQEITLRPNHLQTAIDKVKSLTEGLFSIKFVPFDIKTNHHWGTLMSWFQREVLFLEAESGKIIEETFDYIIKSDLAAKKLSKLKQLPLRTVIRAKYMKKVNSIISKFKNEIEEAKRLFEANADSPPIANNLPPISGSIFWSKEISQALKSTFQELSELKEVLECPSWLPTKENLDMVLETLKAYELKKYSNWSSRVNEILDKNLSRNLIRRENDNESISRFSVDFTSDLSDTFAEVINMEKLGYKVPEVAKNMSLQEAKLNDISEQLTQMLSHYHQVIDSVDGADKELILENLKNMEKGLNPGLIRLTWNSLGISDYISQSEIIICRTESTIRQILAIKGKIEENINNIMSARMFCQFQNCDTKSLKRFEEFHSTILTVQKDTMKKLVGFYEDICPLLMKVEEVLVSSRTKKHPRMKNYFSYWEGVIYETLKHMLKVNLEDFLDLMESKEPLFNVEVVLLNKNVALEPSEQVILKGIITFIKCLLDGTQMFIRWGHGTCIPVTEARVKGKIRPIHPSFFDDIIRIPDIIERVEKVQQSIVSSLENVKIYLSSWRSFKNLWKFDKNNTCIKFLERTPSCVDFDAKLLFYSLLERQIQEREFISNFKCIQLSLKPIKITLLNETKEWSNCLGTLLEQTAKEELTKLQSSLDNLMNKLIYPKNGEELENVLRAISSIWKMSLSVEMSYKEIEEKYRTLQMYGIQIEETQIKAAQNLPNLWNKIFHKSKEVHFRVTPMKQKYTEITKMKIRKFKSVVNNLYSNFKQSGPTSVGSNLDQGLLLLTKYQVDFKEACFKAEELNEQEKLYVLPLTNFEVLQSFRTDIETLDEIYVLYKKFSKLEDKWKKLKWKKLDLDFVKKDILKSSNDLVKLQESYPDQPPLLEIEKRVNQALHLFEILKKLKESKLRSRHWKEISRVTNVHIEEDINFNISHFWNFNFQNLECDIDRVINQASHERKIESEIQEFKELWESAKFSLHRECWLKDGDQFYILGDVTGILDDLLLHQGQLDQMIKSVYSAHFSKEISFWKTNLTTIERVVQEWIQVQECWIKISKALAVKGFRDSLTDPNSFEDISKRFVRIMVETAKKPTVKDICLSNGFLSTIQMIKNELEEFQKDLVSAFDLKRKEFPRFFFLSDDELITVLGGNIRELEVQEIISNLFQNLSNIKPNDLGIVEALLTQDDEDLPLIKSVNVDNHPVEVWLSTLVEEAKVSMKLMVRLALQDCRFNSTEFITSLMKFPNVLSIAIYEKLWTDQFENAFQNNDNGNPLSILEEWKKLYFKSCQQLEMLQDHKNLSGREQVKNCFYMTMIIAKRDLIDSFLNLSLSSEKDFNWEKIMKYYWSEENYTLEVKQGFFELDYGYEFMGVTNLSINNLESERIWFLINETIRNHNIPCLSGAPMTGKTAIIEDLGKKLGKGWKAISSNQNFTVESLIRFMRGICESNLWGIIDNVNLLKFSVMSEISSHFQAIKTAQTLYLREFALNGKLTKMSPRVAFICTESNLRGSYQLQPLPLSLRTMFRRVSVEIPNMEKLFSTIMRINGLKYPVTMSKHLISASNVVGSVLNLGTACQFSAFKIITAKLVDKLKQMIDISENNMLYIIMLEYYKNLLTEEKFAIASNILQKHFKIEKEVSLKVSNDGIENFNKVCHDLTDYQKETVLKLLDMLKYSNSVILHGPAFTGKTKIVDAIEKLLSTKTRKIYFNPSSYDTKYILGSKDNPGIIAKFFSVQCDSLLIHLDGACNEQIALPLSTILDKQEYYNGNGIQFISKGDMKILVETTDISEICESLKSRSLILQIKEDAKNISWAVINKRISILKSLLEDETLIKEQCCKLLESLRVEIVSSIDCFLNRCLLKKLQEALDIFECLIKTQKTSTTTEILIYAFQFAFTSCEAKQQKNDVINCIKTCVLNNKSTFGEVGIRETLPEVTAPSANFSKFLNTIRPICKIILANQKPILIIGNMFAHHVYETIYEEYENKDNLIIPIQFHTLSSSKAVSDAVEKHFLRRGQNILVPKNHREILVAASDLLNPTDRAYGKPIALLGDIAEMKTFVFEEDICRISDVNVLSKVSPVSLKFKLSRSFNKFVCIFIEDIFEDIVDVFKENLIYLHGEELKSKIEQVASVSITLMSTAEKHFSVLSMNLTTDILVNVLLKLQKLSLHDGDIITEYAHLLSESLVYPEVNQEKKRHVLQWLQLGFEKCSIPFAGQFDIYLSDKCIDIVLTEEQKKIFHEISRFLESTTENLISLFGEHGYGVAAVLESACKAANYSFTYLRRIEEMATLLEISEKHILIVKDCYVTEDRIEDWLEYLPKVSRKKIAFLISTKSTSLIPWQQWLLSYTRILGISHWSKHSLGLALQDSPLESAIQKVLVEIHLKMTEYSRQLDGQSFPVFITLRDLTDLNNSIQKFFEDTIENARRHNDELKAVLNWMKKRQDQVMLNISKLGDNEKTIEKLKESMKSLKKTLKGLEDDKKKLTNDLEEEVNLNQSLKVNKEVLTQKYDLIRSQSFDAFEKAKEGIKDISSNQIFLYSKPMLVHEDIEKIANIIMILFRIDFAGWKPFKDRFLSQNWQKVMEEFDPDSCKHKQEFLINKKLAEIKTSKGEVVKFSPISGMLWSYVTGALSAFKTKFERDKLSQEIKRVQISIDESEKHLLAVKKSLRRLENEIAEKELDLQKLKESCLELESATLLIDQGLKIENKFLEESKFLKEEYENELQKTSISDKEMLANMIMEKTVSIYLGRFESEKRSLILQTVKDIVNEFNPPSENQELLSPLQVFLRPSDFNFCNQLKSLTQKRVIFCYDPNDVIKLLIKSENSVQVMKLISKDDLHHLLSGAKQNKNGIILVEDVYFENSKNMNKLLHQELDSLLNFAESNKVLVFLLTKILKPVLPYQAISSLYFLNCSLNPNEVIYFMIDEFNNHCQRKNKETLLELQNRRKDIENKIVQGKLMFYELMNKQDKIVNEEIMKVIEDLKQFIVENSAINEDITTVEQNINNTVEELPRDSTPVVIGLFMLSKFKLCPVPSFYIFVNTAIYIDDNNGDDDVMHDIFKKYSLQIPEKGRVLFATFMSIGLMKINKDIKESDICMLVDILTKLDQMENETKSTETFRALLQHYQLEKFVQLEKNELKILIDRETEIMKEKFYYLMISVILEPAKVNSAMIHFVDKTISDTYLKSETIFVSDVHQYSSPYNPIVFLLESTVQDPCDNLTKLADLQGIASSKVKYLALSKDNITLAMALLETAFIRGQWLIFQNVDLVPFFLPILEKQINSKDKDDVHDDFRVWMTWCQKDFPSFTLLQKSIILNCEPSSDIRFHNTNFHYNVAHKSISSLNFCQSVLFLTLSYLQKIFICRQKFSALSWTNVPSFPNYLVQMAHTFIERYFLTSEDSPKTIQYEQLRFWIQVKYFTSFSPSIQTYNPSTAC